MSEQESSRPALRKHRSHDVLPLDDCPITVESAAAAVLSAVTA